MSSSPSYVVRTITRASGHDARMVSKALAALREDRPYLGASGKVANYAAAVERVGSPALAQKFLDAVAREANRAEAKKARQGGKAKTAWQATDDVKVGRWTYPARTNGKVTQRNTKRDGSGEWVAV